MVEIQSQLFFSFSVISHYYIKSIEKHILPHRKVKIVVDGGEKNFVRQYEKKFPWKKLIFFGWVFNFFLLPIGNNIPGLFDAYIAT